MTGLILLLLGLIIFILVIIAFYQNLNKSIPKIIYQTYMDKKKIPDKVYSNIKKFAPGYQHIIYEDSDCIKFINQYFGEKVVKRFKALKGAHKADLFRYCLLYIKGGIYLDVKTELIMPLKDIFTKDSTFYTVLAKSNKQIYQGVIATPKGNEIFLKLIDFMMRISLRDLRTKRIYLIFTADMYRKINEITLGNKLKNGPNRSINSHLTYELFQEKCNHNSKDCVDGLDRYGYCCYIYRNNKKIIKTRYADFPWK